MWQQKGEDKGRWTEYINANTGESSIKEHTLKTLWKSCKPDDHYWEVSLANPRELVCKHCKGIQTYVLGFHQVIDGKIVERKQS